MKLINIKEAEDLTKQLLEQTKRKATELMNGDELKAYEMGVFNTLNAFVAILNDVEFEFE